MGNPPVSGSGNAKLSTAFDVIRRFILQFAWDMPEIGFIGTGVSQDVSIDMSPFACRVHPGTRIGQSDGFDEYRSVAQPRILDLKRHPTLNHQKKRKTAESRQPQI